MDLSSRGEIDKQADQLLRKADVLHKFPTPVENIIAAQHLIVSNPDDSPLAPGMIARAPAALREKLSTVSYKVLAILDRRERVVHIHPETSNTNHERFNKLHEVGHDICPWQVMPHEIDGRSHLDPGTQELFEKEANYAGARLLFQGDVFIQVAQSYNSGIASVIFLADQFGSSIHAAFHQYVTTHHGSVAGYILQRSPKLDPATGTLNFSINLKLPSAKFARTYIPLQSLEGRLYSDVHLGLKSAWSQLSLGQNPSNGEIRIQKRDGSTELAPFEMFSNSYNLFMLINADRRHLLTRNVRIVPNLEGKF